MTGRLFCCSRGRCAHEPRRSVSSGATSYARNAGTRIAMANNEPGVGRAKAPFNRKRVRSVSANFHGDLYKIPMRFEPASSRIPMPSVTPIAVKNVRNSGFSCPALKTPAVLRRLSGTIEFPSLRADLFGAFP